MFTTDKLLEKWNPVLDAGDDLQDRYKRSVTATVLENTEKALAEERGHSQFQLNEAAPANATGSNIGNWDPILISLVRRAMPNLIAYDIAGVQPMTGPTGLIFAMKSKYSTQGGTEALFNEADTAFAGAASGSATASNDPFAGDSGDADTVADYAAGTGMATADAEALGSSGGGTFNEMAFSIEKATVTAKSRALKAEYSMELAQDLKAIHGLDAESELANILSAEILAEINREVVRTINLKAKAGSQQGDITTAGTFDVNADSDGRWSVEKYKGLLVQMMREANVIAKETRRGKGNFILCSSDVAAALSASGMLDYTPALAGNANLTVDDTGTTFAGTLAGGMKVYIDPYAAVDYVNIGYKGANPYDAGIFYCPYVPLTMVRAVGENTFQPKIGFKTRYGMIANPFVATDGSTGTDRANQYYRITKITNILS
tara:strand:- start:10172 stop:11470 length:1299 start_codon:yes stop_codon:yes gene_type:complete